MDESGTTGIESAGRLSAVVSDTNGVRVVTLTGEIDHDTGGVLGGALDPAGAPTVRMVVDLRQVTFMDSSGINILIAAHNALTERGGWLRLASPSEIVARILHIVGVDSLIDTRETLEEALHP
ncbi:STAS domain-containing protein [Streptomyces sp. NPDC001691]|uniref:STAS domain-containing protein n=1 Tax=unclassified Streptomyces TaxID=2593676 RepID=UPI000DEAB08C|nr:STAS domain-containing protein [Streptomyces sp. SDr-06]RCH67580.1 anti-sigma factor antagonist [Streptomyces sp. SDr-06]